MLELPGRCPWRVVQLLKGHTAAADRAGARRKTAGLWPGSQAGHLSQHTLAHSCTR